MPLAVEAKRVKGATLSSSSSSGSYLSGDRGGQEREGGVKARGGSQRGCQPGRGVSHHVVANVPPEEEQCQQDVRHGKQK